MHARGAGIHATVSAIAAVIVGHACARARCMWTRRMCTVAAIATAIAAAIDGQRVCGVRCFSTVVAIAAATNG